MGNARRDGLGASNVALLLLKTLATASECFPPLKSAADVTVQIVTLVKDFKANQRDWKDFGAYVQDIVVCVIEHMSIIDLSKDDLRQRLAKFLDCLQKIHENIKSLRSQSVAKRLFEWTKDSQQIDDMRKKLSESLTLFQLEINIGTRADVAKLLESLRVEDVGKVVEAANRKLTDKIVLNSNLEKLQYVKSASWNKNRACLPGTRTSLINEIMSWAHDKTDRSNTVEIYLLSGVAGSGKTSIAHSIAQRCFEEKLLLSSFFFHRETAGLNVPDGFITTLARDLGRVNSSIAESIAFAVEDDPALALAHSMSHQFQKLIIEPLRVYPVDMPLLIVIDALDEGFNKDFLTILCEDVLHLPPMIRIFVTSRPEDDIMRHLSTKSSHIYRHSLDIHDSNNRNDVLIYIRHLLHEIAVRLKLGESWPTDDLIEELATKSEGLFIWASTVINYIEKSLSPEDTLLSILSESTTSLAPGKKMDGLYENILGRCNWDDVGFVKGYNLLMGTIMALRTPLSISAIRVLHSTSDARLIDRIMDSTLGSLLPTSSDVSRPLQVLHLSFRDFVTTRAGPPYFIDQKSHSQRLALLCLRILNETLQDDIPGTGYLLETELGLDDYCTIPTVSSDHISEGARYACRFWIEHVLDIQSPSEELQSLLATFLNRNIIRWVEVMISLERYQRWIPIWEWIKENLSSTPVDVDFEAEFARSVHQASVCLRGVGRFEEALESIHEAVELRRGLFAKSPDRFILDLSSSMNLLCLRLADLGQHADALKICCENLAFRRTLVQQIPDSEAYNLDLARVLTNQSVLLIFHGELEEALESIQEASRLYDRLADTDSSPEFQWDHAKSLNNLSLRLSDLGRWNEALQAVQQSVALFRQHCDASPLLSKSALAMTLSNLSNCLSNIGRHVEALGVIQESVDLYRQLVKGNRFTGELAMSLNNLSSRLLDVGENEQALVTITEASDLYRKLVECHPAAYTLHLAKVLNNQSNVLSALGRQRDALVAVQEAVKIYRKFPRLPPIYRPDFTKALNSLSTCLSDVGQHENAITLLLEAIQLNDENDLADEDRRSLLPRSELAMSFNNLSSVYSGTSQPDEALDAAQRALELYRKLAAEHPTSYRQQLATALYNVSEYQCAAGRRGEALEAVEEAITIYHALTLELPTVYSADLKDAEGLRENCLRLQYEEGTA
ncbi:TPR-like protein [Dendrothele bispora CBS 962.96]|uniref:TPR-like protein n=1 Tax=Dendrothele bispora (strain CBS 962.96) TaxID=1314807 RepID=A0A4S8LA17_DENBC|nr:TPR-like protein [Dendrothele bispora CBS 962.96]